MVLWSGLRLSLRVGPMFRVMVRIRGTDLSRIRAHPIYFTIQILCVQQPYTMFRYIINAYSVHTFTLILRTITHLQHFSEDEMYANLLRTVAPCHGSRIHPCGGASVRGQSAYNSSSEKSCKCVIIQV